MTSRVASDEEIKHKFTSALSEGIKVRRHERGKFAEVVTIFGEWMKNTPTADIEEDTEQLTRILWEPEVS